MTQAPEISEAIRLHKAGQLEPSRQLLRGFLQSHPANMVALLWLAKVSPDAREAQAAAELALALQPENEVAQRAVAAVAQRQGETNAPPKLDVMRLTGLTVMQARAVNWPFKGLNRPLGILLDEGVIELKDLGYAVAHAFDAQLKRAASTLLLQQLLGDGLKDPPPGLKVYGHRSWAARNERIAILQAGIMVGLVVVALIALTVVAIVYVYSLVIGLARQPLLFWSLVTSTALLLGFLYIASQLIERVGQNAENSRAGAEGERRASELLQAVLCSPWALFRNVEWPNRQWGDVDLILVGPGGVWVFEVKAYSTPTRNIGDRWEYKGRWGWRKLSQHPGQQARRNATRTKSYLEQHGAMPGYVQAVVIWAGDAEGLTVDDPATPVWKLSELADALEVLWQNEKLSSDQVERCSAILGEVIAKEEAEIAARQAEEKRKSR